LARGYNGPSYAINQYDTKLAQAYQRYSTGPMPDLNLRAAQLYLTFAGMNPGPVDGLMGAKTRTALQAWQQRQGLPQTGQPDDATLASLFATLR
jgi:peptidoglycan hydrolase-like protein with peptidoglycan-binding domain